IRAERLIWGGKTIWDWPPETNWRLAGCPTPAPGETPAPCNRDKDAALALEDNMFDAVDPPLRIEWILSNSTGTAPNHYITRIGHNGYAGTPSSLAWSFPLRTDLPDWYWFQGKTSGVKSQDFDDCPNPAAPGGCDAQGTASARCRVEMLGTTDLKGTCIIKFKKVGQFQWSINPEACPVSSEGTPACAPWSCPAGTLCSQPAL
ncbi:MAG: hypothetical protein HY554_11470, partial [Elusimicrobia bacterium]|nr:hypothetical protein [Elusimicrobiota bacterium]